MNDDKYTYDKVNFHKSFIPQEVYITKILELAQQNYTGTKEEISEITGIPTGKTSGKVIPHIKYSNYMGLIEYELENGKFTLKLTPLGETVILEDKYLFEDITKLICHFNICDDKKGAYIWSALYFKFSIMFNEETSFDTIKKKYKDLFLLNVETDPFRKAYSADGFWYSLGLMDISTDSIKLNSLFYNDSFKYAYAYLLLSAWDNYFPGTVEITTEQIIGNLNWNKRIGFDEDEMLYTLEELETEGILKMNKQLVPYTVIRTMETDELLPRLYELLS